MTLMKLPAAMRIKYDQFMAEGSLIVLEGAVLDMMDVYEDLDNHISECGYDVRCLGFDRITPKNLLPDGNRKMVRLALKSYSGRQNGIGSSWGTKEAFRRKDASLRRGTHDFCYG